MRCSVHVSGNHKLAAERRGANAHQRYRGGRLRAPSRGAAREPRRGLAETLPPDAAAAQAPQATQRPRQLQQRRTVDSSSGQLACSMWSLRHRAAAAAAAAPPQQPRGARLVAPQHLQSPAARAPRSARTLSTAVKKRRAAALDVQAGGRDLRQAPGGGRPLG